MVALTMGGSATYANATDWLQFGYNEAHTSFNDQENGYSTATGNKTLLAGISIKTAGSSPSSKSVDSAPVLATGIVVGGVSKDVLYLVAKDGTILAVDAATGTTIWSNTPASSGQSPTNGSALVDAAKQFVYAYALDGKVHKYAAATGVETTTGGWPVVSTLKAQSEKGAASLSTATTGGKTYLYSVTDGYIGDGNDYQGHVTTIDLSNASFNVFNTECSNLTYHFVQSGTTTGASPTDCASKQNGIWGRPGAVFDAGTGRMFISTGNGPYDPTGTTKNAGIVWGDSILALNPNGTGTGSDGLPVDSYTPSTFQSLQNTDADLGSASIAIVPAPAGTSSQYAHIGAQVGKDGCVRLINLANMSGQGGAGHTGGELDTLDFPGGGNCASGNDGPEIKPQPAVWVNPADGSSWFYVMSYNNGSAAYKISLDAGKPQLSQQWTTSSSGSSAVVANGAVYFMSGSNVIADDAVTGTTIWTSPTTSGGLHWQSLILANGKIYMADNNSKLWAYQLDGIFRSKFE
jgi:outer membrane protein assembly factor BamB